MVVCQFYLKGSCKFGNRCRYEHTNNTSGFAGRPAFGQPLNDRYHFTSINKGFVNSTPNTSSNVFASKNKNNVNTQVDHNAILQLVRKELQDWDTNKVWPLSCFAAQREQNCLPGLEDSSPEELRLEAYKYQELGNFQTYLNGISTLSNAVISRRNELKNMSNERLIQEIQSAITSKETLPSNNLFSSNNSSSSLLKSGGSFGANQAPQTGIFGSNVSSTTSSSIFGSSNQNTSLFNLAVKPAVSNPFATSSSGFFTNNTTPAGGIFGNTNSSNSNPFLKNTSTGAAGGLFTNNSADTMQTTTKPNNLFSETPFTNNAVSAINPFAASTASSTGGGLFSQPVASGMSGASLNAPVTSQVAGSVFGASTNAPVTNQGSAITVNPFLSPKQNQVTSEPVKPAAVDQPCIIKVPLVTPADIEKFKADEFILGQIPTCPPPPEVC